MIAQIHQLTENRIASYAPATAPRKPAKPKESLPSIVDQLGDLKARISDLETEEAALRDKLVASGLTEIEGTLFRCTVSRGEVTKTDYKSVLGSMKMTPTIQRLMDNHTSTSERTTVKVVSR